MLDKSKPQTFNAYDRPHADLRESRARQEAGELLRIRGADWELEMGTLAEIVYRERMPPAILFEDIPGYPKGMRASLRRDQFVEALGDHSSASRCPPIRSTSCGPIATG